MFLLIWTFLLFTSTFAHMMIAGIELAETGGNLANLLFSLCLIFCGVLATPDNMPRFWIFMYRVSPFTYLVSAMLSTGVSGTTAVCGPVEYLHFAPPSNMTCQTYMEPYIEHFGGYLQEATKMSTTECSFCTISSTDTFLASVSSYYKDAWRNFGIMWVFIIVNIILAVSIYWLARVPKGSRSKS
jgi:ABC-type multidrug transport system permease subunit